MARSLIQRRQDAARQRNEAYDATLRRVFTAARQPPECERAIHEAQFGVGRAIRDAGAWRPKLKTRDPARLRLAAARHLFANYPVPSSLERIWLDSAGLEPQEILLRKHWYAVAARGDSLYKAGAGEWLSRKEVHWFLNPPGELSFEQAFWQAIARTFTGDLGVALRIARSKLARTPREALSFWREAARFFCANPLPIAEIDDLCDYLAAAREGNRDYSLKGRTLASLQRQMRDWHRDLQDIRRIDAALRIAAARNGLHPAPHDGRHWKGSAVADWSWQPSAREQRFKREEFVVIQLKTAAELVAESRAMHHCVSSYAAKCIAGSATIWSLRQRAAGRDARLLTIELDRQDRAVQVRGFSNRSATPDEQKILTRWSKARGIILS